MTQIVCQCERASHFDREDAVIEQPDGRPICTTADHVYSARVNYIVRGGYGIYQCGACEKAGHSPMSREQAIKHNKAIVSGQRRGKPRLDFVNNRGE